uniref:Uncharacterized protein n=1 Tax=Romanomermis culicivorax TaxID=13658 RepID=A0A915KQU8_ROMCU
MEVKDHQILFSFHRRLYCEDFINVSNPTLHCKTSRTNASITSIYIQHPEYGHLFLKKAVKICRLCHDADLVLLQDTPDLNENTLPVWISVTAQVTLIDNQATNVTWTPYIVDNVVWPIRMDINRPFPMLA